MKKFYTTCMPAVIQTALLLLQLFSWRKNNGSGRPAFLLLIALIPFTAINKVYADVSITSVAVPATGINQGSNNNVIYIAQLSVTVSAVNINNIQFTVTGTHDANDLETVLVYFNATAPSFAGSSFQGSSVATFAGPHTYSINLVRNIPAGTTGYFIIVGNVSADATDNNTIKINGAANPVLFGFTAIPTIINNQTDIAGTQTIQAPDITTGSIAVAATGIAQGSNNNIIYIAQMSVATNPVDVNNIQFTLSGTHDANDLATVLVYFNATSPVFAGSSFLGSAVATFAGPHTYSINLVRNMPAGSTGYFIIVANVNSSGTDNNTVKINGASNPVIFGFTTSPNITNAQTDAAGTQTIAAADITVTTSPVVASGINQGSNNNIIYIAHMSVATNPVDVNNIQFTLSGTHDANDLETVLVYFNATSPVFAGSSFLGSAVATFAGPHTYSINLVRNMPAGSTGYFIIVANVNSSGTDNNTVKINGAGNPVVFGFTTSPNINNTQTDAAGIQTIQAADIVINTAAMTSGAIAVGSDNNVVYAAEVAITTMPVQVNNIQFTLSGTHDANDISNVLVYFNGNAPVFAGSSFLGSASAAFAGPHTYSINITRSMAAGTTGYYIIVVNINPSATTGHTITINGATNPVLFGFTTSPNIMNNQQNTAGLYTLPVTFISVNAQIAASGVAISWKTTGELNIEKYIAERSADGMLFNSIGQIKASGSFNVNNYQVTDAAPNAGKNYYRVRAMNLDGRSEFSSTVSIDMSGGTGGIAVYPNPVVKTGMLTLSLQNLPQGSYLVTIHNTTGQLVHQQKVNHNNGSSVWTIALPVGANGIYLIEVRNQNSRYVKSFMTE